MGRSFTTSKSIVSSVLRVATSVDLAHLAAINAAASAHPWAASQFDLQAEHILLVERDGESRGFIVFSQVSDEGSILNMAVHPDCQRQGLARQLLQAALQSMAESGAQRCLLEVRSSNHGASALYENFGFQIDATRKNYYPAKTGREDAILMSKNTISSKPEGVAK